MRLSQERWPAIPGEERQREDQQETGQREPDDDMRGCHNLLYLLCWAEGTLCVILDIAVFRRMAYQPAHVSQAKQADALDLFLDESERTTATLQESWDGACSMLTDYPDLPQGRVPAIDGSAARVLAPP